MTLEARGVSHNFGDQPILRDVNLEIAAGERVALIGANGAGKTTLLRILAGALTPTHGTALLGGVSLDELSAKQRAQQISVVPQASPPAFGFRALEIVLMGFHARLGALSLESAAQVAQAHAALDALDIAHLADRPMTQLSGGEAQRVIMARTLVSQAPFWLLDEPTASLDLQHQLALLDKITQHCDDGGAALAIVHDPNLVERAFDRVVVLADARIVSDGPPAEALNVETFQHVFGVAMRYVGARGDGAWVPAPTSWASNDQAIR